MTGRYPLLCASARIRKHIVVLPTDGVPQNKWVAPELSPPPRARFNPMLGVGMTS